MFKIILPLGTGKAALVALCKLTFSVQHVGSVSV